MKADNPRGFQAPGRPAETEAAEALGGRTSNGAGIQLANAAGVFDGMTAVPRAKPKNAGEGGEAVHPTVLYWEETLTTEECPLRVTLLGTGTSHGVPVIACDCPVCRSADPRNRRHRTSAYLEFDGHAVLIDTPPEFRLQALTFNLRRIDAVLMTHSHADHIAGFDDLRRFNEMTGRSLPVYGNAETMADIRRRWGYIFDPRTQLDGGKPDVSLAAVDGPFTLFGMTITPIPVRHGRLPVLGYRVGCFAYLTDCSDLPAESRALLGGLDVLILGAIRRRPHTTHFNLEQALAVVADLQPDRTYLTHLTTHDLEHEAVNRELPPGVELGYDGLTMTC